MEIFIVWRLKDQGRQEDPQGGNIKILQMIIPSQKLQSVLTLTCKILISRHVMQVQNRAPCPTNCFKKLCLAWKMSIWSLRTFWGFILWFPDYIPWFLYHLPIFLDLAWRMAVWSWEALLIGLLSYGFFKDRVLLLKCFKKLCAARRMPVWSLRAF